MLASTIRAAKAVAKKLSFSQVIALDGARNVQHKKNVSQSYRDLLVGSLGDELAGDWLDDAKPIMQAVQKTFEDFQRDRLKLQEQIRLEIESAKADEFGGLFKKVSQLKAKLVESHAKCVAKYQSDLAEFDRQIVAAQSRYSAAMRARQRLAQEFPNSLTAKSAKATASREIAKNRLGSLERELRDANRDLAGAQENLKDHTAKCYPGDEGINYRLADAKRDLETLTDRRNQILAEIKGVEQGT